MTRLDVAARANMVNKLVDTDTNGRLISDKLAQSSSTCPCVAKYRTTTATKYNTSGLWNTAEFGVNRHQKPW